MTRPHQIEKEKTIYQLTVDEGLRLHPYRCSSGRLTIGYGRNLEDRGISLDEAGAMLEADVDETFSALSTSRHGALFDDLPSDVRAALANMGYNLGISGLLRFTKMWTALEARDYETAADEMLNSRWARQVGDRAQRLARMVRGGGKHS